MTHRMYFDKWLKRKNINNKAHLVAGYCWEWLKDGKNRTDIHDIVIEKHDFSISGNWEMMFGQLQKNQWRKQAVFIHAKVYVGVIIGTIYAS